MRRIGIPIKRMYSSGMYTSRSICVPFTPSISTAIVRMARLIAIAGKKTAASAERSFEKYIELRNSWIGSCLIFCFSAAVFFFPPINQDRSVAFWLLSGGDTERSSAYHVRQA